MNDLESWIKLAVQIVIPVGTLIYGYARLNAKVERNDEKWAELAKDMDQSSTQHEGRDSKQFEKLEKYAAELFMRIEKVEREQSVQGEINRHNSEQWKWVVEKLNTIESLLRLERRTDR